MNILTADSQLSTRRDNDPALTFKSHSAFLPRRLRHVTIGFSILVFFCASGLSAPSVSPAFPQEVYVWQRAWTDSVREAVTQHASNFTALVVLKAEVSWKQNQPRLTRVALDYSTLTDCKCPIGLALRIGPYRGRFSPEDKSTLYLTDLAAALIWEAKTNHLAARELQIDFDCAESKLDGYRIWVEALRRKIAPVPLIVTALPSWLKQSSLKSLVAATDGYILQVHSLERPRGPNEPFTLCDPAAAQRAVERAAALAIPFRVALPTYGYTIAFDKSDGFIGLSAEGPHKTWPAGSQVREVRANPFEMARLVQFWTTNQPSSFQGIIWYRLPVSDDILNWRWPTLACIMAGRSPRESFRAGPRRVEPRLVEISLANDGELDISSRLAVEVRWSPENGMRLVAGDGLRGFELVDGGPSTVQFQTKSQPCRLPAGEKQVIGWLRFNQDREVHVEIKKL